MQPNVQQVSQDYSTKSWTEQESDYAHGPAYIRYMGTPKRRAHRGGKQDAGSRRHRNYTNIRQGPSGRSGRRLQAPKMKKGGL